MEEALKKLKSRKLAVLVITGVLLGCGYISEETFVWIASFYIGGQSLVDAAGKYMKNAN
jgi:hypothetical protein